MADIPTIVTGYQDNLLEQYVNAPNARATIGLIAQTTLMDLVELAVQDAYDINTAVGVQLDVLGEYIGFSRLVYFPIDRYYFTLLNPDAPIQQEAGFTDYTDSLINADSNFYLYQYAKGQVYYIPDDQYRVLLKLKIILNQSHNTLADIASALWQTFGADIICFDQKNMFLSYVVSPLASNIVSIALKAGLLPKPMGVGIDAIFILPNPELLWGFVMYDGSNANTTGFCDYATGFNGEIWINYLDKAV